MTVVSKEGLYPFVEQFLHNLPSLSDRSKATVIALTGNLGAGKTLFTQKLAQVLGVVKPVPSPTFVIQQIYQLPEEAPFNRLIHIDAYRLDSGEDMLHLDWDKLCADPQNLIVVEWADNVEKVMPPESIWLTFKTVSENEREITFEK